MLGTAPPRPSIDARLLDTAIDQFGRFGLEGTSTRTLAAAAGTTMSAITYHYGGKDGLYLAAASHIAGQMSLVLADAPGPVADDPVAGVLAIVDRFATVMLRAESAPWARFIVREQMAPTAAFEILYDGVMGRMAGRLADLVERAGAGRWSAHEARIRAVAIVGQVLVFRVAHAAALRITGWEALDDAATTEIRAVVRSQTAAVLAR